MFLLSKNKNMEESNDFKNINIKEEVVGYEEFNSTEQLIGKIVEYKFLVTPKKEQNDIKHQLLVKDQDDIKPNHNDLVGDIMYSDESRNNSCDNLDLKSLMDLNDLPDKKLKFACDQCTSSFPDIYKLKFHMISHSETYFKCNQCNFNSKYLNYVKRHLRFNRHKGILQYGSSTAKNMFVCNECGYETASDIFFKRHLAVHTDIRKFSCDLCSYTATRQEYIKKHKHGVHLQKKPVYKIVCDQCGKKFQAKYYLDLHLVQEHKMDLQIKTYICYTCGYKSIKRGTFITHISYHSKHNEMFCANCDYKTRNKTTLIQHMVKHRKNVKMHKCHVCEFETKRPHTLRHHIKTHLK